MSMSDAGYAPESPIPTINLPRDTRDAATSSINLPPEHLGGWKFSPPPGLDSNFHAPSSLLAARYRGMLMKFKSSQVSLSSRISIFENHRSFVENGRPGLLLSAFSSVSRRLEVMGKSERSYPCAGWNDGEKTRGSFAWRTRVFPVAWAFSFHFFPLDSIWKEKDQVSFNQFFLLAQLMELVWTRCP